MLQRLFNHIVNSCLAERCHFARRRGGGSGWVIALVVLLALVAGVYFFTQMSGAEMAKGNAVTNAANEVGSGAKAVGAAAKDAADK